MIIRCVRKKYVEESTFCTVIFDICTFKVSRITLLEQSKAPYKGNKD